MKTRQAVSKRKLYALVLALVWLVASCNLTPAQQPYQAPSDIPQTAQPTSQPTASPAPPTASPAPSATSVPPPTSTSPPATASPSPTPAPPTLTASITTTSAPTQKPSVTPWWTPIPTRTATITLTPTPQPAALRFLRPGAYSRVLSPLRIEASVMPGEDGLVLLELTGEDGRVIVQQRLNYSQYLFRSIAIAPQVEFSIPGVAETARLSLSINDRLGRRMALASMELVLLSIGSNDFLPASEQIAPYLLYQPYRDQIVTGGNLLVRGAARPLNTSPLLFDILDEENKAISTGSLRVAMPSGNATHTPFEITLPYSVTKTLKARLVVRQESDNRIPGTVALWSVAVQLQP